MLLERTNYLLIETAQPAIFLEWVSPASGVFGSNAVFRWQTRDITTGQIVIQILRGATVVYTFPNRTPSTDWVEETWVRIPPRGNFTVYAYWTDNPSINATLQGSIVAQPSMSAVWYVNNQPAGTDVSVERGTPVFARITLSGSDQVFWWTEPDGREIWYDPPSPPGYWNNTTIDIPVSTSILGIYNYDTRLEDIQQNLRLTVTAAPSDSLIEVEWDGANGFPYGATARARWRTENTILNETVELFVVHNNVRTVLGTATPSTSWVPLTWNTVPPRGLFTLGARLVLAQKEAVVVGTIAPPVSFNVDLLSPSSFVITDPNGKFVFRVRANQSEHPVRVYRNNTLIQTFTPSGAWWNSADFTWDDRPPSEGTYNYRFVLENENIEYNFTLRVLGMNIEPVSLQLEWLGSSSGLFGQFLQYRVRVQGTPNSALVYYVRGTTRELLQTVPADGQWHTYPFQVRPPRGNFTIESNISNSFMWRSITGQSQAAPDLTVTPLFSVYQPERTPFLPVFRITVGVSDKRILILRDGELIETIFNSERGYWGNDTFEWVDTYFIFGDGGRVGTPVHYQFVLEDEGIQRDIWIHFYPNRQSDAMLIERTEFVLEEDTPPPPAEERDQYLRLFFMYKLYASAVYFHIMSRDLAATYHQRSNASVMIGDSRKMGAKRYLIIESGGNRQ